MEARLTEAHVRAHPDALGLAVIVANRRGPLPGQHELQNVVTDQGNMSRAFQLLRFAVIPATDISCVDMMALFHDIASYSSYPPSYKRIAVVFAGPGTKEGLCAHDGVVPIKDIIDQFQPANCHPSISGIPKLFFIDACRGDLGMGVVVAERGGTAVPSKVVTQYGNSLVAYSTMAGYKAYEVDGRGGMWMSHLSEKLLQDKSILDIMTDINESLMGMFQEPQYQLNGYAQQPTCESNLNETVNLFRESQIGLQTQAAACLPSVLPPVPGPRQLHMNYSSTDRSRSMEHYDGTDVYQQALEAFIKDHWVQGYRESTEPCVMGEKIVYCTKIECTVGVEAKEFLSDCLESEEGSKEQAAMKAVHFIQHQRAEHGGGSGGGGSSSPLATNQQGYKMEEASCEAGVTMLNPTFTHKNVVNALKDVVEWKLLGDQLDISAPKIKEIDIDNRGQVADCRRALVQYWLESDVSCSWKKLIDALKSIDKSVLAEEIRRTYCPMYQASPRNFRQELHEWCQRNTAKAPRSFETSGQGHRCVITVNGRTFTSKWCDRKKGAEEGAAMEAIKWLPTHTVAPPTSGQPGKMHLKEYCDR